MPRASYTLARAALLVAAMSFGISLPEVGRAADAALPSPPLGFWLSQDHDGVFEIKDCGTTLCGRLVGIRYEGAMPMDSGGHPQCGLMMLTRFVRQESDPGRWSGLILDPEKGRTYHAVIWSPKPGLLNLRGYLLLPLFGQTQHWTRYQGSIGPACHLRGRRLRPG